jgi:hypothetical protein
LIVEQIAHVGHRRSVPHRNVSINLDCFCLVLNPKVHRCLNVGLSDGMIAMLSSRHCVHEEQHRESSKQRKGVGMCHDEPVPTVKDTTTK